MKKFEPKPFRPFVTKEQIVAFDPARPETFTASPLLNAVLEAINVVGPGNSRVISKYMCVPGTSLWRAVELICGMNEYDLRKAIISHKVDLLKAEHPEWNSDMLARAVGYSTRTGLYRVLGRERFDKEVSNLGQERRFYKNRVEKGEE